MVSVTYFQCRFKNLLGNVYNAFCSQQVNKPGQHIILYKVFITALSFFHSILPQWEMRHFFLLFQSFARSLVLGECSSHSSSLLGPQVQWSVLLGPVELPKVLTLGLADYSEDTGNRLPDKFSVKWKEKKIVTTASESAHWQSSRDVSRTSNVGVFWTPPFRI